MLDGNYRSKIFPYKVKDMTNITLLQPIYLYLEPINFDDILPSVQFKMISSFDGFLERVTYECDIWIENEIFENFISVINDFENNNYAELTCMSKEKKIYISKKNDKFYFGINFKSKSFDENTMCVDLLYSIDVNILDNIRKAFNKLDKWW